MRLVIVAALDPGAASEGGLICIRLLSGYCHLCIMLNMCCDSEQDGQMGGLEHMLQERVGRAQLKIRGEFWSLSAFDLAQSSCRRHSCFRDAGVVY